MVIQLEYDFINKLDWRKTNRLCNCPNCGNTYFKQSAKVSYLTLYLTLFLEDCLNCGHGEIYTNNPDVEIECIYNPFFKG